MNLDIAVELCKHFEGLKLKPYICPAGVPTVGYGSTFYEDGRRVSMDDPAITQQRAEELLRRELRNCASSVVASCTPCSVAGALLSARIGRTRQPSLA